MKLNPFHSSNRPALRFVFAFALFAFSGSGLQAQDLRRVQPQPAPRRVPAGEKTPPADLKEFAGKAGAMEDEEIILPRLKGLVFLGDAGQIRTNGFPGTTGFDISRVEMLQKEDFEIVAHSFLDQPVSQESLLRVKSAVKVYLGAYGFPYTSVYIPPQDITDGVVQVVAQPSLAADEIRVEGSDWFSEKNYRRAIRQKPGEAINVDQLKEDIDWLNRNPFRQVSVVTRAGGEPGTTTLALQASESIPFRMYGGFNNTGTQSTQEERMFFGMNWGNAFGRADQLGFQLTSSLDFKTSVSVSGNYAFDLPWRHTVRLITALSELNSDENPPLSLNGQSWQAGLRYEIPLPNLKKRATHGIELGLDFKSSDNNLEFSNIPVTDNLTHVAQASLSYRLSVPDKRGQTSLQATLFGAPGGLTHRNEDAFFSASRAGASADYVYGTIDLRRQTQLPRGFVWSKSVRAQASSANLIGSEQFGAGGSYSVRGYEEGEVFGDQGVLLSHELIYRGLGPLEKLGMKAAHDNFQPFIFQDYAWLSNVNKFGGERPNVDLHSVGAGVRYNLRQNLNAQFSYGWQLIDSGSSNTGDNSRGHLSVTLSF